MPPKGFPYEGKLSAVRLTEGLPPRRSGPKASPMRGSCRRRRLMRWAQLRRRKCLHLIRHGSAVPPSPHRGRLWGAQKDRKPPRKKVQSDKLRLHLLFAANIQRQRLIKLIPTYQAARTKTPVR